MVAGLQIGLYYYILVLHVLKAWLMKPGWELWAFESYSKQNYFFVNQG